MSTVDLPHESAGRSLRLRGLGLVLVTALASPLVWGLAATFGASLPVRDPIESEPLVTALVSMSRNASLLALASYVLWRQGRTLRSLGVTAQGSDFLWGAALAAMGLLPFAVGDLLATGAFRSWLVGPLTLEGVSAQRLATLAVAAAAVSLVFRAYLITEVGALTDNPPLAVVASVVTEMLSQFRFGLPSAIRLLIYCLFYWKTRRATSLLVAVVLAALWVLLHQPGGA